MPGYQKAAAIQPAGNVSVGSLSTLVVAANPDRVEACFVNDSSGLIYLGFGSPAVYGRGVRLDPGGSKVIGSYTGDVSAISQGGGATPSADATSLASASAAGTTLAVSHTVNAVSNRLLVVKTGCRHAAPVPIVSSITWGAAPLTFLGGAQNAGTSLVRAEYWYLIAPATGTATLTVTFNTNTDGRLVAVSTYKDCNQISAFGPVAVNFAASGITTPPQPHIDVVSAPGELVVDGMVNDVDYVATQGSNQVLVHSAASGSSSPKARLSGSSAAGSSSVPMDWTLATPAVWAQVGASLKPVGSATNNLCYVEV